MNSTKFKFEVNSIVLVLFTVGFFFLLSCYTIWTKIS